MAGLIRTCGQDNKDPQDRLIIATAINHNCQLVSADRQFSLYQEISALLVQP